jgi:hypothetical protein
MSKFTVLTPCVLKMAARFSAENVLAALDLELSEGESSEEEGEGIFSYLPEAAGDPGELSALRNAVLTMVDSDQEEVLASQEVFDTSVSLDKGPSVVDMLEEEQQDPGEKK